MTKIKCEIVVCTTYGTFADAFYEDQECAITYFSKNVNKHTKLIPYSIMNVKLAAQILSSAVCKTLTSYGSPEAAGAAKFCLLMDSFFDIVKIRDIQSLKF